MSDSAPITPSGGNFFERRKLAAQESQQAKTELGRALGGLETRTEETLEMFRSLQGAGAGTGDVSWETLEGRVTALREGLGEAKALQSKVRNRGLLFKSKTASRLNQRMTTEEQQVSYLEGRIAAHKTVDEALRNSKPVKREGLLWNHLDAGVNLRSLLWSDNLQNILQLCTTDPDNLLERLQQAQQNYADGNRTAALGDLRSLLGQVLGKEWDGQGMALNDAGPLISGSYREVLQLQLERILANVLDAVNGVAAMDTVYQTYDVDPSAAGYSEVVELAHALGGPTSFYIDVTEVLGNANSRNALAHLLSNYTTRPETATDLFKQALCFHNEVETDKAGVALAKALGCVQFHPKGRLDQPIASKTAVDFDLSDKKQVKELRKFFTKQAGDPQTLVFFEAALSNFREGDQSRANMFLDRALQSALGAPAGELKVWREFRFIRENLFGQHGFTHTFGSRDYAPPTALEDAVTASHTEWQRWAESIYTDLRIDVNETIGTWLGSSRGRLEKAKNAGRYEGHLVEKGKEVYDARYAGMEDDAYYDASRIQIAPDAQKFIGCHCPENYLDRPAFFQVLRDQNVHGIMMYNSLGEAHQKGKYWPDRVGEEVVYHNAMDESDSTRTVRVKLLQETHDHDAGIEATEGNLASQRGYITERRIAVTYDDGETRIFKQLHYQNWEDHGVPDYRTLARLRGEAKRLGLHHDAPIASHCHGGRGRNGTATLLWSLLDRADSMRADGSNPTEIKAALMPNAVTQLQRLITQRESVQGANQLAGIMHFLEQYIHHQGNIENIESFTPPISRHSVVTGAMENLRQMMEGGSSEEELLAEVRSNGYRRLLDQKAIGLSNPDQVLQLAGMMHLLEQFVIHDADESAVEEVNSDPATQAAAGTPAGDAAAVFDRAKGSIDAARERGMSPEQIQYNVLPDVLDDLRERCSENPSAEKLLELAGMMHFLQEYVANGGNADAVEALPLGGLHLGVKGKAWSTSWEVAAVPNQLAKLGDRVANQRLMEKYASGPFRSQQEENAYYEKVGDVYAKLFEGTSPAEQKSWTSCIKKAGLPPQHVLLLMAENGITIRQVQELLRDRPELKGDEHRNASQLIMDGDLSVLVPIFVRQGLATDVFGVRGDVYAKILDKNPEGLREALRYDGENPPKNLGEIQARIKPETLMAAIDDDRSEARSAFIKVLEANGLNIETAIERLGGDGARAEVLNQLADGNVDGLAYQLFSLGHLENLPTEFGTVTAPLQRILDGVGLSAADFSAFMQSKADELEGPPSKGELLCILCGTGELGLLESANGVQVRRDPNNFFMGLIQDGEISAEQLDTTHRGQTLADWVLAGRRDVVERRIIGGDQPALLDTLVPQSQVELGRAVMLGGVDNSLRDYGESRTYTELLQQGDTDPIYAAVIMSQVPVEDKEATKKLFSVLKANDVAFGELPALTGKPLAEVCEKLIAGDVDFFVEQVLVPYHDRFTTTAGGDAQNMRVLSAAMAEAEKAQGLITDIVPAVKELLLDDNPTRANAITGGMDITAEALEKGPLIQRIHTEDIALADDLAAYILADLADVGDARLMQCSTEALEQFLQGNVRPVLLSHPDESVRQRAEQILDLLDENGIGLQELPTLLQGEANAPFELIFDGNAQELTEALVRACPERLARSAEGSGAATLRWRAMQQVADATQPEPAAIAQALLGNPEAVNTAFNNLTGENAERAKAFVSLVEVNHITLDQLNELNVEVADTEVSVIQLAVSGQQSSALRKLVAANLIEVDVNQGAYPEAMKTHLARLDKAINDERIPVEEGGQLRLQLLSALVNPSEQAGVLEAVFNHEALGPLNLGTNPNEGLLSAVPAEHQSAVQNFLQLMTQNDIGIDTIWELGLIPSLRAGDTLSAMTILTIDMENRITTTQSGDQRLMRILKPQIEAARTRGELINPRVYGDALQSESSAKQLLLDLIGREEITFPEATADIANILIENKMLDAINLGTLETLLLADNIGEAVAGLANPEQAREARATVELAQAQGISLANLGDLFPDLDGPAFIEIVEGRIGLAEMVVALAENEQLDLSQMSSEMQNSALTALAGANRELAAEVLDKGSPETQALKKRLTDANIPIENFSTPLLLAMNRGDTGAFLKELASAPVALVGQMLVQGTLELPEMEDEDQAKVLNSLAADNPLVALAAANTETTIAKACLERLHEAEVPDASLTPAIIVALHQGDEAAFEAAVAKAPATVLEPMTRAGHIVAERLSAEDRLTAARTVAGTNPVLAIDVFRTKNAAVREALRILDGGQVNRANYTPDMVVALAEGSGPAFYRALAAKPELLNGMFTDPNAMDLAAFPAAAQETLLVGVARNDPELAYGLIAEEKRNTPHTERMAAIEGLTAENYTPEVILAVHKGDPKALYNALWDIDLGDDVTVGSRLREDADADDRIHAARQQILPTMQLDMASIPKELVIAALLEDADTVNRELTALRDANGRWEEVAGSCTHLVHACQDLVLRNGEDPESVTYEDVEALLEMISDPGVGKDALRMLAQYKEEVRGLEREERDAVEQLDGIHATVTASQAQLEEIRRTKFDRDMARPLGYDFLLQHQEETALMWRVFPGCEGVDDLPPWMLDRGYGLRQDSTGEFYGIQRMPGSITAADTSYESGLNMRPVDMGDCIQFNDANGNRIVLQYTIDGTGHQKTDKEAMVAKRAADERIGALIDHLRAGADPAGLTEFLRGQGYSTVGFINLVIEKDGGTHTYGDGDCSSFTVDVSEDANVRSLRTEHDIGVRDEVETLETALPGTGFTATASDGFLDSLEYLMLKEYAAIIENAGLTDEEWQEMGVDVAEYTAELSESELKVRRENELEKLQVQLSYPFQNAHCVTVGTADRCRELFSGLYVDQMPASAEAEKGLQTRDRTLFEEGLCYSASLDESGAHMNINAEILDGCAQLREALLADDTEAALGPELWARLDDADKQEITALKAIVAEEPHKLPIERFFGAQKGTAASLLLLKLFHEDQAPFTSEAYRDAMELRRPGRLALAKQAALHRALKQVLPRVLDGNPTPTPEDLKGAALSHVRRETRRARAKGRFDSVVRTRQRLAKAEKALRDNTDPSRQGELEEQVSYQRGDLQTKIEDLQRQRTDYNSLFRGAAFTFEPEIICHEGEAVTYHSLSRMRAWKTDFPALSPRKKSGRVDLSTTITPRQKLLLRRARKHFDQLSDGEIRRLAELLQRQGRTYTTETVRAPGSSTHSPEEGIRERDWTALLLGGLHLWEQTSAGQISRICHEHYVQPMIQEIITEKDADFAGRLRERNADALSELHDAMVQKAADGWQAAIDDIFENPACVGMLNDEKKKVRGGLLGHRSDDIMLCMRYNQTVA